MGFVYIFQNSCVRMDMQRNDENDQSGQCNGLLCYNPSTSPSPSPTIRFMGGHDVQDGAVVAISKATQGFVSFIQGIVATDQ